MQLSRLAFAFYLLGAVFLGIATSVLLRGGWAHATYFVVPAAVMLLAGTIVAIRTKLPPPSDSR